MFQPPSGKPIATQRGPKYILQQHPYKPDVLFEPTEEPFKDGGEFWQKVKIYLYDKQKNELKDQGLDMLPLSEIELCPKINIDNPIRASRY